MMRRREFMALPAVLLREDSAARVLDRELAGAERLLLRIADGSVIAQHWDHPSERAPLASLSKPFITVAYARSHAGFPRDVCRPGRCWLPAGHGAIGIDGALAYSCNAYFAALSAATPAADFEETSRRFGIALDAAEPLSIARGFAELAQRRSEAAVRIAVGGMRLCAREGTASGARARIAAKTGTARCCHSPRRSGDGWLVSLFPEDSPEYVLLVRRCGMPGAATARSCAAAFRAMGLAI